MSTKKKFQLPPLICRCSLLFEFLSAPLFKIFNSSLKLGDDTLLTERSSNQFIEHIFFQAGVNENFFKQPENGRFQKSKFYCLIENIPYVIYSIKYWIFYSLVHAQIKVICSNKSYLHLNIWKRVYLLYLFEQELDIFQKTFISLRQKMFRNICNIVLVIVLPLDPRF